MNNEEMKTCYNCDTNYNVNEGVTWGRYFYCDNCFKELKCNVDSYHRPTIDKKFKKSSEDNENEKLFLAFELETTKNSSGYFYQSDHVDDVLYIRKNYKELDLNFEQDASIGNGMEIISQPMTYKYIKENQEKLDKIFSYLSSKGNYSHDKGKCGLHIHVSKNALGDTDEEIQNTIEKIMLFVETYRAKMERYARRKHNQFSSYNSYTIPTHNVLESDITDETYYKSGKMLYDINKYDRIGHSSVVNVNASTGETIEFRMFRGTLKYKTFMASIEFIYNLVNVCKENMVSKISWEKVINYGGDFIKEYNDSLDLIEDNMFLRDYTSKIESIIKKNFEKANTQIDNYKKDLNELGYKLQALVNEPIDFTSSRNIIKSTLDYRANIYRILETLLIDNLEETEETSLYVKLKNMNKDYSNTCKNNLKEIKSTLKTYSTYTLTETTINHANEIIAMIDEKINNSVNDEGGEI